MKKMLVIIILWNLILRSKNISKKMMLGSS